MNYENTLKTFLFKGRVYPVSLVDTIIVTTGVICQAYSFVNKNQMDLAIITIQPGARTPKQKVILGTKTIEGYLEGKGKLTITKTNKNKEVYIVTPTTTDHLEVIVSKGEIMQWKADDNDKLIVYEICYPPYQEGRFINLS